MSSTLADMLLKRLAGLASPGGERGRLSILIYHRVFPVDDPLNPGHVTASQFDAQMRAVASQFSPLALDEALDRMASRSLPPRALAVTFDDGYADNAETALPILVRHGVPATFFVATAFTGGGRMWNDTVIEAVRALQGVCDLSSWGSGVVDLDEEGGRTATIRGLLARLKYLEPIEREAQARALGAFAALAPASNLMLSRAQIRELRAAGMSIGAHTTSHVILARCTPDAARAEIVESGCALAEILREPVTLFAYPNGKPGADYTTAHARMVREAGYRAAVTTVAGAAAHGADVYQLPRFTPWDRDLVKFSLRLLANARRPLAAAA